MRDWVIYIQNLLRISKILWKKSAERFSEPKIWIVMQLVKLCTKFGETKKQCKYSNALLFRIHSFLDWFKLPSIETEKNQVAGFKMTISHEESKKSEMDVLYYERCFESKKLGWVKMSISIFQFRTQGLSIIRCCHLIEL